MRRFSEAEKAEGGESMRSIARRLGRQHGSVRTMSEDAGGVRWPLLQFPDHPAATIAWIRSSDHTLDERPAHRTRWWPRE